MYVLPLPATCRVSSRQSAALAAHSALSAEAKAMDHLLSQRLLYHQKKEDAVRKIRDLGALPTEAFERYKDKTAKQLFDALEKTQAALKKFSGVNRKAIEQYTTFTEQKAELSERKQGQKTNALAHATPCCFVVICSSPCVSPACAPLCRCLPQSWTRVATPSWI